MEDIGSRDRKSRVLFSERGGNMIIMRSARILGRSVLLASLVASAVVGILVFCSIPDAAAQSGSRSGWYVGGSIGSNWASDIDQEGWNRETTCYPNDACFDVVPIPAIPGYRWRYDIASAAGAAFDISAGRIFGRTRLELSFAQRTNGLDQRFRSITDYEGMSMEERRGGTVVSNSRASIDKLIVRTFSFNAYYDFPYTYRGISFYLGGGFGPAFVVVSKVHFSTNYEDTSDNAQTYDPPLSFYNSSQEADLSDTVLAGRLHAGADYDLNDKTLLGLKLTYSMTGDVKASGGYSHHPFHEQDPDLANHNTFTGPRYWTLTLTAKRLFSN